MTDKEIDARIDQVKKQSFAGSQAKLDKQLKEQGYTKESLRADIKAQLLSEKIYDAVTKDAKVTDAEIAKYYQQNKSQYSQAESRDVRHILVKTKAQANKIYDQIKAGGNFAALAKKYSTGPGLEGQRRQADDHPRADGRPVRHDRVPALDEPGLPPDQDRVRLPRDPADLRRQAGEGDAAQGRQACDPGARSSTRRRPTRSRKWTADTKKLLRQEGRVRDRVRPARGRDRHGDDHRPADAECLRRAMDSSPRRSSTCKS